jgi:hypothetical protein
VFMSNASRFVGLLADFERQLIPLHQNSLMIAAFSQGIFRVTIDELVLCSDDRKAGELLSKSP